jgi:hypothetical protein
LDSKSLEKLRKFALKDQKQEEVLSLNFHLKESNTVKGSKKQIALTQNGNTFYQLSPDMKTRKAEGLEMMTELGRDKRRTEVIPKVRDMMMNDH